MVLWIVEVFLFFLFINNININYILYIVLEKGLKIIKSLMTVGKNKYQKS